MKNKIIDKISPYILIVIILSIWQILSSTNIVPKYMLPSPYDVIIAFILDFKLIMKHTSYTLIEAFIGLSLGIILAFIISIIMDSFDILQKAFYPILIITQTIPTVAIAPLLVLWMGYGITPKITLILITSFFPIAIGLYDGYRSVDIDSLNLLRTMGANKIQEYLFIKLPYSLGNFFTGLRISVSYAIISAVVAEWLGGFWGLGVYMTRVRKSYSFDKMFAVIFFISALSLFLMYLVKKIEKRIIKW